MTALLDVAARAPMKTADDLLRDRRSLVVVAPHPDDETLGCGGLLHEACRLGLRCRVICMTDGSASHPNSARWGAGRLARTRKAELQAALGCLDPDAALVWMGYRDCGLPGIGAPGADGCIERLRAAIGAGDDGFGAMVLATWRGDPHVDHVRTAALVAAALEGLPGARALAYPIWGRFEPQAVARNVCVLPLGAPAAVAKRRALSCHATQMTRLIDDDPSGFVMTTAHQDHFLDHPEIFLAA